MSAERTIANFLRIAAEDLAGARVLADAGNRNAAYLAEQAAEKVIRAILTSEGVHAGVGHDLRQMVSLVPEINPLKRLLVVVVPLAAYATAYRYPTSARIPPGPPSDVLAGHLAAVSSALVSACTAFGVDPTDPGSMASRAGPVR